MTVDVLKHLAARNLKPTAPDLTQEDALAIVTELLSIVFDCPADVFDQCPPESLRQLPDQGQLHELAIPRYRILCALGRLRTVLDTRSFSEFDLVTLPPKKPSNTSAMRPGLTSVNKGLMGLCRTAQEFVNIQAHFNEKCALEINIAGAAEESVLQAEAREASLENQLIALQESVDIEKVKEQLLITQSEITEAKNALEACGRDLKSAMEHMAKLQSQEAQKQREYDSLEMKIRQSNNELERLRKDVVEDPEHLRLELASAKQQLGEAEKEAMEAMRQEKVMLSLAVAYDVARQCCEKQRKLMQVFRNFTEKAQKSLEDERELARKDEAAQIKWKTKLQQVQKAQEECLREEKELKAKIEEWKERERLEREQEKIEAETITAIGAEIARFEVEAEKERERIKEITEHLHELDHQETKMNRKVQAVQLGLQKWDSEALGLTSDALAALKDEQETLRKTVTQTISNLR